MTEKQRPFGVSMTEREFDECLPADEAAFRSPIPTQVVLNGEYNPLPQTDSQKKVEFLIKEIADRESKRHNTSRRTFLASTSGMAASFTAMNMVYGDLFDVSAAEVTSKDAAGDRKIKYKGQFIFDDQTHMVRDDFAQDGLLGLTKWAEGDKVNPNIGSVPTNLSRYKMDNYLKEIFLDSDTTVALLSGAPFDDPNWNFISNDAIQTVCRTVNKMAGSVRMLGHSIISPKYPNWMDEVDRCISELKPVSWKAYTLGDPFGPSKFAWQLDDEKLMYPFYEKAIKAGINTICIHKGLMPRDYEKAFAGTWENATVNDVGKAAKDWPGMNFVIYHGALRPWLSDRPDMERASFEKNGYIQWSTDLARIPEKFGVKNVYAEIGSSFASTAVTDPEFCAAFLGQLVNLMGPDRVVWGTDSVFYGSPQWQIEALRRLEIPEAMMKKQGWKIKLGDGRGAVKNKIFGENSAKLYKMDAQKIAGDAKPFDSDMIAQMRAEYLAAGGERSNAAYGYIAKEGREFDIKS